MQSIYYIACSLFFILNIKMINPQIVEMYIDSICTIYKKSTFEDYQELCQLIKNEFKVDIVIEDIVNYYNKNEGVDKAIQMKAFGIIY